MNDIGSKGQLGGGEGRDNVIAHPMSRCAVYPRQRWLSSCWYLALVLLGTACLDVAHAFRVVTPNLREIPLPSTRCLSQQHMQQQRRMSSEASVLHASRTVEQEQSFASNSRDGDTLEVVIKPVGFHGLRSVSRLLVEGFHGNSMWFPVQCMVELERLQSEFHSYGADSDRHLMLIATSAEDGSLAGFVNIDGRSRKTGQGQSERRHAKRWNRVDVNSLVLLVAVCLRASVAG